MRIEVFIDIQELKDFAKEKIEKTGLKVKDISCHYSNYEDFSGFKVEAEIKEKED